TGYALRFEQSKYITVRGLTISGAGSDGVTLLGGVDGNQAIHLERLRIFANGFGSGSPGCGSGIKIGRGNAETLITNSLVYGNGRDGIETGDGDGGPHYIVGNTIHGNAWNGVRITSAAQVVLVNNAITGNGTAAGSSGGRFGVSREDSASPNPLAIQLLNNLICGNRLGEIDGPALDATDAGNLTPTGAEGPGVAASPGCDGAAAVYANAMGGDGTANTADDNFALAETSPAIDAGLDPRTLGFPANFNALFETDFAGVPGARPKNATGAATARFDIGAFEASAQE